MADSEEKPQWLPERNENILHNSSSIEDISKQHKLRRSESSGDTRDENMEELRRIRTSRSVVRQRTFEPIITGDREELTRIASQFAPQSPLSRTSTRPSGLARMDTLYGLEMGQAVLDPSSPDFDAYKWARM